jgi:hypothetical protein
MELEVEVRLDPVGIAGVADETDRLTRGDTRAALQPGRERGARCAASPVVVRRHDVVVQVHVQVRRPAVAVEVEHAARPLRAEVVLHLPGLGGHRQRLSRRHDVDALMAPLSPGRAEIVAVTKLPEYREDDSLAQCVADRLVRNRGRPLRQLSWIEASGGRSGHQAENGNEEDASGYRPVASHNWDSALRFALEGRDPSTGFGGNDLVH